MEKVLIHISCKVYDQVLSASKISLSGGSMGNRTNANSCNKDFTLEVSVIFENCTKSAQGFKGKCNLKEFSNITSYVD